MWLHASAYLVLCWAFSNCATLLDSSEGELVAVVTLYRHGDRAPTESFPTDKYFDKKYWPMGFTQLTNVGKKRQYGLGKWLRSRYESFLPEKYASEDIYIRSTDADRTLMSAYLNLAGLYSPKEEQIWNANLLWQPIPVHTIPRKIDDVIVEKRECRKYDKALKEVKKNDYHTKINKDHAQLYAYLSKNTGWNVHSVRKVKKIKSIFYSYENYNVSFIPDWAKSLNNAEMDTLTGVAYQMDTYTEAMKRLRTGPFFHHLFAYLDNVVEGKNSTVKFYMFSAHEPIVAAVLNSMGAYDVQPVEYAATVIWELRRIDGSYFVNLLYKTSSGLKKINISSCTFECNYASFKSIMTPITTDLNGWIHECQNY